MKEIYYFYVGQILPESCEESSLKMKRTLSEVTLKNRSNNRPLPYGRHTRRFFDLFLSSFLIYICISMNMIMIQCYNNQNQDQDQEYGYRIKIWIMSTIRIKIRIRIDIFIRIIRRIFEAYFDKVVVNSSGRRLSGRVEQTD